MCSGGYTAHKVRVIRRGWVIIKLSSYMHMHVEGSCTAVWSGLLGAFTMYGTELVVVRCEGIG